MSYTATETLSDVTAKVGFANGHTSSGALKIKYLTLPKLNVSNYNADSLVEICVAVMDIPGMTYNKTVVEKDYVLTGEEN